MDEYTANRKFMKSGIYDIDIIATADIARGISRPPFEKPYSAGAKKTLCQRLIEILLQR